MVCIIVAVHGALHALLKSLYPFGLCYVSSSFFLPGSNLPTHTPCTILLKSIKTLVSLNLSLSSKFSFECTIIEKTHSVTFYNAVICHTGETERAATYCHSTLQRQLQLNQFNPMEWALNAATLSQYYITKVGQML